jgi:uncharacterized membrane protein YkvA (DUF1232 family)
MGTSSPRKAAARESLLSRFKRLAERLETETVALALAYRDPRTPWYAKLWTAFIVAHTLSPIDLIPDFIPVIGYLDDLIITPFGIWLALKMIPPEVMAEARERAAHVGGPGRRLGRWGAVVVVVVWLVAATAIGLWLWTPGACSGVHGSKLPDSRACSGVHGSKLPDSRACSGVHGSKLPDSRACSGGRRQRVA